MDNNLIIGFSNLDFDTNYIIDYKQDKSDVKVKLNSSLSEYNQYADFLLQVGFCEYAKNQIVENRYAKFINNGRAVSLAYSDSDKKLTIIAEAVGGLFPRKEDNSYEDKGMTSLFTGMKNENNPIYSGMGFVIRLCDGSFIIIDGGGGDLESKDSNRLLNILYSQKPTECEKPIVSAWIFTHCHDDHLGVFTVFSEDFHDKIVLEKIYYNFPNESDIRLKAKYMFNDAHYSLFSFYETIRKYYSDAEIITAHSGEEYYIKNSVIEMLLSYEDLYPLTFTDGLGDINESSLVFKIHIGGQTLLINADIDDEGINYLLKNFGDYLKSDIMQMSHHGQNGTVDYYKTVNPQYALMPITHTDENRPYKIEANKWLVSSENLRQILTFWSDDVIIPIPYNPLDSEICQRIPTKANNDYKDYSYLF